MPTLAIGVSALGVFGDRRIPGGHPSGPRRTRATLACAKAREIQPGCSDLLPIRAERSTEVVFNNGSKFRRCPKPRRGLLAS
ncbi:hypothetical protein M8494_28005 [Serratia ureilytica]